MIYIFHIGESSGTLDWCSLTFPDASLHSALLTAHSYSASIPGPQWEQLIQSGETSNLVLIKKPSCFVLFRFNSLASFSKLWLTTRTLFPIRNSRSVRNSSTKLYNPKRSPTCQWARVLEEFPFLILVSLLPGFNTRPRYYCRFQSRSILSAFLFPLCTVQVWTSHTFINQPTGQVRAPAH